MERPADSQPIDTAGSQADSSNATGPQPTTLEGKGKGKNGKAYLYSPEYRRFFGEPPRPCLSCGRSGLPFSPCPCGDKCSTCGRSLSRFDGPNYNFCAEMGHKLCPHTELCLDFCSHRCFEEYSSRKPTNPQPTKGKREQKPVTWCGYYYRMGDAGPSLPSPPVDPPPPPNATGPQPTMLEGKGEGKKGSPEYRRFFDEQTPFGDKCLACGLSVSRFYGTNLCAESGHTFCQHTELCWDFCSFTCFDEHRSRNNARIFDEQTHVGDSEPANVPAARTGPPPTSQQQEEKGTTAAASGS